MPTATATLADLDAQVTGKTQPAGRRRKLDKNPPLEPMGDIDTKHRAYTDEPALPTSVLEMEELAAIFMGKSCPPLSEHQLARQENCPKGLGGKAKAIYIMCGLGISAQVAIGRKERDEHERQEARRIREAKGLTKGGKPRKGKTTKGKGAKAVSKPKDAPETDGLLTAGEVAEHFEVDAKTFRRFLRTTDLEKTDGKWVFTADQVTEMTADFEAWAK